MCTSKWRRLSQGHSANYHAQRNFRFVSIFGFSMILMATWETALGRVQPISCFLCVQRQLTVSRTSIIALINGGTAGFIWMYLVAWAGFMCVNTSMAEMGSMSVLATLALGLSYMLILQPQGSDLRRSVPLGFRICTQEIPEIHQLHNRLALRPRVADWSCQHLFSSWHPDSRPDCPQLPELHLRTLARHALDLRRRLFLRFFQHLTCKEATLD
jgi:hypothetical protein